MSFLSIAFVDIVMDLPSLSLKKKGRPAMGRPV